MSIANEMKLKTCCDCKVEFEKSDKYFYGTGRLNKDGSKNLKSICKKCHNIKNKERFAMYKEKGIVYKRPYRDRHEHNKRYNSDKAAVKIRNRKAYLRRKKRKGIINDAEIAELEKLIAE